MVLAIFRPKYSTGSPSWNIVCPCDPINSIVFSGTPVFHKRFREQFADQEIQPRNRTRVRRGVRYRKNRRSNLGRIRDRRRRNYVNTFADIDNGYIDAIHRRPTN